MALTMAEALEAAHEAGVIQRDLKPANVKVKPDGMQRSHMVRNPGLRVLMVRAGGPS